LIDREILLIYGKLDSGKIIYFIVDKKPKCDGLLIKEIRTRIIWAESFKNHCKEEKFLAKIHYWEEVLRNGLDWY